MLTTSSRAPVVNSKLEGGLDLGTGLRGRVRFEIRLGHVTGARSRNVAEASER